MDFRGRKNFIFPFNNFIVGVRWIRMDGQSLPSNSYENNGELFIQNVKPSDGGRYGCQALDPNGRVIYTAITNLVISCKLKYTF